MKRRIRLTEGDLRRIVNKSVRRVLREMDGDTNQVCQGFLDCARQIIDGGCSGFRIVNGKVYQYSLATWKRGFDMLCNEKGGLITYQEYINWLDENCLTDLTVEDVEEMRAEKDAERSEAERIANAVREHRAEFENACDDLYYGYGYQFWRTHNNDIEDEELAKLVWKAAFKKMSEEN